LLISGHQQHLRAFASAFGHQRQPYLDARACSLPSLSSTEWRLAAKTQAEQWAIHAAAAVAAELPRRMPGSSGQGIGQDFKISFILI
jgi:hypothetical protein